MQTITTFRNPLADPVGTRRGPPLVRGPQFENRCVRGVDGSCAKHLTVESFTVVMPLTVILIIISISSPLTLSFQTL